MGGDPEGTDLARPVGEMLRERFADRGEAPVLIGIAGSVAVGKTTFTSALVTTLGEPVEVLGTDAFLYSNSELAVRGLAERKGFPESYDRARIEEVLAGVRAGRPSSVPVYSHLTYDIVPGATREVVPRHWFVLEGVNALQFARLFDCAIYIEAPLPAIEEWFVSRLTDVIADPPAGSFYDSWATLTPDELDATARGIWRGINVTNLEQCIAPTRTSADIVVIKGPDHRLVDIEVRW